MWVLVGLLVVAGLVELPLYAVRASGEALSFRLLEEALFDTRVGQLWILRLVLGILTTTAATYAAQQPRRLAYWWGAAIVVSASLLLTLTQQSHAAAEEGFLPLAADWLHLMAASLWMGGLLGFSILLVGPLRAIPIEPRLKLLSHLVPRFSKVATMAVMGLILTGLVAVLLHVPNVSALINTPYGRALSIKLGLLIFLLALGAQNLRLRGRGPFSRLVSTELILAIGIFVATGFLTSLPPADAEQPTVEENIPNPAEDIRQPPMPDVQGATAQPKE
jgi:copper transport protein